MYFVKNLIVFAASAAALAIFNGRDLMMIEQDLDRAHEELVTLKKALRYYDGSWDWPRVDSALAKTTRDFGIATEHAKTIQELSKSDAQAIMDYAIQGLTETMEETAAAYKDKIELLTKDGYGAEVHEDFQLVKVTIEAYGHAVDAKFPAELRKKAEKALDRFDRDFDEDFRAPKELYGGKMWHQKLGL